MQVEVDGPHYVEARDHLARFAELIRADEKEKARAAPESEILKGLQSGDSTPMTDQDWREIRGEVRKRHARRNQA